MNAWSAIFRAEFRRVLAWLPWLAGLHGLLFWMRTRPAGEVPPVPAGAVEWGAWAFAAVLLATGLWPDSPSRRERFLATRPLRLPVLVAAKLAALVPLVALPFALGDGAMLAWAGQPPRVVLLGTLQTGLLAGAATLAAFPFLWFWPTRATALAGVAAGLGGVAAGMALLGGWPFGAPGVARRLLLEPPAVLGFLTLATAATALLLWGRFAGGKWLRVPLFGAVVGAAALVAGKWALRAPAGEDRGVAPLVHLTLSTRPVGDRLADWLEVEPPSPELRPDEDVVWSFSALRVNGRAADPWPFPELGGQLRPSSPDMERSQPVQQALRARFGARLAIPAPQGPTFYPAATALPGVSDPARPLDLGLKLSGTVVRWQVVADLPLAPGAQAAHGVNRWTIERVGSPPDGAPDGPWGGPWGILRETVPWLWLGRGGERRLPDIGCDRYFLVDPQGGRVFPVSGVSFQGKWRPGRTTLRERTIHFFHQQAVSTERGPGGIDGLRLAIVRALPAERIEVRWNSPEPLSCAGLWLPREVPKPDAADPRAGTARSWLAEHPAPDAATPAAEVDGWLRELSVRIGKEKLAPAERQALVAACGKAVKSHPRQVLQAFWELDPQSSNPRHVMYLAVMQYMTIDLLRDDPGLIRDSLALQVAVERGWHRELAPAAAAQTRLGWGWRFKGILLRAPREAGMSDTEWQAFFRIYPSAEAFRALCGVVLPREFLERVSDLRLAGYRPQAPAPRIDPLLELALARGRREAPRWLREALRMRGNTDPVWVRDSVSRAFEIPAQAADGGVDWFLAQDPDRFAFDAATGKFHLR